MPIIVGAPQPPPPHPDDRELAALRAFADTIRAEHAEKGHITRGEISAAIDRLDDATRE